MLASVIFDAEGRLLVTAAGQLPSRKITDAYAKLVSLKYYINTQRTLIMPDSSRFKTPLTSTIQSSAGASEPLVVGKAWQI